MPKLLDEISTFVTKIDDFRGSCLTNESNTKAALIEPMLKLLGWDTTDPNIVDREFKNDNTKSNPVDYALKIHRETRLLVEAKALGVDLLDRQWIEQIVKYAATAGIQWGVLTNGDNWLFVKCLEQGDVTKRVFRDVRISKDSPELVASTLQYLSYEHWQENDLEMLWKIGVVDKDISEAVMNLFRTKDKGLARLLVKRLDKHSLKNVVDSLARLDITIKTPNLALLDKSGFVRKSPADNSEESNAKRKSKPTSKLTKRPRKKPITNLTSGAITLTLDDSWRFKRPLSFRHPFSGKNIVLQKQSWYAVYASICQILCDKDAKLFRTLLTHQSFSGTVTENPKKLHRPKPVADGIYIEANATGEAFRMKLIKLSGIFSKYAPVFSFTAEQKKIMVAVRKKTTDGGEGT